MSVLQKLTEGIVHRDVAREGHALLSKWEKTGLLEGMGDDRAKNTMAVLLENQAKELLREASAMAAGDVEGFAAVAFPIVRRVFGGLIANDLVSVQPMSLPSGLIFFLDFSHSTSRAGMEVDKSIYGGDILGKELATNGVDLNPADREGPRGFYDLGTGFSSPTGSAIVAVGLLALAKTAISALTPAQKKLLRFDPDILAATATDTVQIIDVAKADFDQLDVSALTALTSSANYDADGTDTAENTLGGAVLVRRLTSVSPADSTDIRLVFHGPTGATTLVNGTGGVDIEYPMTDDFTATGPALGAIVGQDQWGLEEAGKTSGDSGASHAAGKDAIPEIDIKVDSIAVTAVTKKLKAKWTPELGQDLNAYHNLDAEVELTGILSEHIALEIDQEILGDLINGAKAGTRYWSRAPGLFVDSSGAELGATAASPDFTGTVSEWYETLIETINDVSAQIHRKTLRGGANFVVCSPEVANILEFTSGFRASVTADQDKGTIGAVKSGSLSKKFDVFVDPYFPRNVILVGRKGGSFLESGYVYAPYVPLQVTPTIFGTEDFVPRKGVMTRYAKKMVRPDMYGLVVVRGLLGESGAS